MYFCSIIIPSRDGEEHIETTITSLLNQDVRVSITVVDDHSIDGAPGILSEFSQVTVIRNPVREPKSHMRIGKLLNMGRASMPPAQFYMISGDDTRFPPDYIARVTAGMNEEGVSLASGYARTFSKTGGPEGSGRILTAELWDRLMPFIEGSGWESGLMIKARFMGYSLGKYPVKKEHLRPFGSTTSRNDGYGSYTLGNPLIWVVQRVARMILKKQRPPRLAIQLLMGHIEYMIKRKPKADFAELVRVDRTRRIQRRIIYKFFVRPGRRIRAWLHLND